MPPFKFFFLNTYNTNHFIYFKYYYPLEVQLPTAATFKADSELFHLMNLLLFRVFWCLWHNPVETTCRPSPYLSTRAKNNCYHGQFFRTPERQRYFQHFDQPVISLARQLKFFHRKLELTLLKLRTLTPNFLN